MQLENEKKKFAEHMERTRKNKRVWELVNEKNVSH